ncbi:MAG: glycoside hydrolase family 18 protein [Candidatus Cryptobacteroides sp.]
MKKRILFFMSLFLAGMVSCSEQYENEMNDPTEGNPSEWKIGLGLGSTTRALIGDAVNGKRPVTWELSDKITVFNNTVSAIFTLDEGAGTSTGLFKTVSSDFENQVDYYAVYAPRDSVSFTSGTGLAVNFGPNFSMTGTADRFVGDNMIMFSSQAFQFTDNQAAASSISVSTSVLELPLTLSFSEQLNISAIKLIAPVADYFVTRAVFDGAGNVSYTEKSSSITLNFDPAIVVSASDTTVVKLVLWMNPAITGASLADKEMVFEFYDGGAVAYETQKPAIPFEAGKYYRMLQFPCENIAEAGVTIGDVNDLGLDSWNTTTPPEGGDDKILITGYLPTYQVNDMTDWGFVPHVDRVYFNGLCPNPEGVFAILEGYTENLLTTLGKIQGRCEVYLSIGGGRGFRPDAMAELCLNPEKIPPYLDAFDAYLKENGIYGAVDGIDIDWEGPRVDDAAYLVFLQAIKERFPDKGLTAAISSRHPSRAGNLIGALDEINMMCYTRFENGEHVPMSIFTRAIDEYLEVGVPKEKLLVGVPFYGRTDNLQDTEAVTYREVYESVPNLSPDVNSFVKGGKTFLYNGYTLISQKGEYLRRKRIKGVMVWELAQDISYSNPLSLLRALTMANAGSLVEAGVAIEDVNDMMLDNWIINP